MVGGGWCWGKVLNVWDEVLPKLNKCEQVARGGGSKFWSFCDNVIIECPLKVYIILIVTPSLLPKILLYLIEKIGKISSQKQVWRGGTQLRNWYLNFKGRDASVKQFFFHELKQNVTRDLLKKYFHSKKEEKSISYILLSILWSVFKIIVLPSKIMKYHILKISNTRVTVTQTDLKMRTCVFMSSFIQSITSPEVAKCKVSFIVVYNLISVQRKPLSLYGVGMTGWFSVYILHKDNIKHQKSIFSCFFKIGQSGLTKAIAAKISQYLINKVDDQSPIPK